MDGSPECRICRTEASADRPLFFPCICTGSIKYIHQECLLQWMRYSRKEICELCGHRFSFTPIYSPDMPKVLPLRVVAGGLLSSVATAVKYWLHYTLVAVAWLGIVPLTAYRTYRFFFSGSLDMLVSLPFDMFSTENLAADVFRGCFVVTCTLFAFIGLVWLREQILHGGGPDWLERDEGNVVNDEIPRPAPPPQADNLQEPLDDENGNNNEEIFNNNNNNNVLDANIHGFQAIDENEPFIGPQLPPQPPPDPPNPQIYEIPQHNPINNAEPPIPDNDEDHNEPADNINNNDDVNEGIWNPMEFNNAELELTWERLLGLDGSMVFLEHVFWVVSLDTLFIFIFAFLPYTIGNFAISFLGIKQLHFHGLVTTLCGYCLVGVALVNLHAIAKILKLRRPRRILGLCYIVVKVSLLSVVEIGVLPLICGWWLDICSLPMFDATLKDRKASFKGAPGTSIFIHWMFGMVYVYYFASFIVLLREVLRPGVLWFLRNLNDPDFSPIQEMIHLSILRHIRRLIASAIIFGSAVLLMLWLPIKILKVVYPTFLPYTLSGDSEVNELSLQLLLLQIILPGFFEQSQTRIWLKGLIRIWCNIVSWILGIKSYLLGSEPRPVEQEERPAADQGLGGGGLGAAHQALLQRDVPVGFQPYDKPSLFAIRLIGLLIFMCISLVIGSLLTLTVPVWIGRHAMALWSMSTGIAAGKVVNIETGNAGIIGDSGQITPTTVSTSKPHELYTAAIGIYLCWLLSKGIALAVNLFPQGRAAIVDKFKHWCSVAFSYGLAATIFVLMLGVVPLMFGLLLELVVVVPLRVPLNQTPVLFLWQDWALGVLYTKIACALIFMGPDFRLKRAIEQAYRDGLREMDLKFIIRELAIPIISTFGLALSIPYVIAHSILPIFFTNQMTRVLIARRIYPFFLIVIIVCAIIVFQIKQFKKLYIAIKNDKYLVGKRLVNYDHQRQKLLNQQQQQQQHQQQQQQEAARAEL